MRLKRIRKEYGGLNVLRDFSLELADTGAVCLFGPSGSGKTTLLRILAGLEKADGGEIEGLEGKRVSMVFQEDRLIDAASPLRNVELAGADRPRALKIFTALGLTEKELAAKKTRELSGGMQRRVALARALAFGGEIYLLDEPFKGLDEGIKFKVVDIFKGIAESALVIFSTHDRQEALWLSDQIIRLDGPPLTIVEVFSEKDEFPLEKGDALE